MATLFLDLCHCTVSSSSIISPNLRQDHLSAEQTVVAASVAKAFATFATYPSQVVRTRLQLQQVSHQPPSCGRVQQTWSDVAPCAEAMEGLRGCLRGEELEAWVGPESDAANLGPVSA